MHVDPPAPGMGIEARHASESRGNRKCCACSHCRHLLEHFSTRNASLRRPETWPGQSLRNGSAFTWIGHQCVLDFSLMDARWQSPCDGDLGLENNPACNELWRSLLPYCSRRYAQQLMVSRLEKYETSGTAALQFNFQQKCKTVPTSGRLD
jgi:hypothetical protein